MTTPTYHWFVLHTLSGQEYKVKESIDKRIQIEEMQDLIQQVLIPTEKVAEVKQGKKRETTRKFFPGYVLVQMSLYTPEKTLNERSWHFIQQTPGIIGFIGGDKPVPLRQTEVDQILGQITEKQEKIKPKVDFAVGETIKINDGPFLNFNGVIEEVDGERGRLKVSVSIFGRSAPVDLEFWQVEKV